MKRIVLSLVSFFAMATMWASLTEAYQVYATGANGKTNGTAEITLNMKNRNAIGTWSCELVLPAGVSYESIKLVDSRYPETYAAVLTATSGTDNTVTISCEGEEGVTLTGTDGAVAIVTVKVAADATLGENVVTVKNISLIEAGGTIHTRTSTEFKWIIEEGAAPAVKGDVNGDGEITIADAVTVLNVMAGTETDATKVAAADVNGDESVTVADAVTVLNIMAGGE